jgi:hypothetical protein
MNLRHLADIARGAWRPLAGYSFTGSLIVGLFNPSVTDSKMLVIAGLLGGLGYLRTQDKKVAQGEGA